MGLFRRCRHTGRARERCSCPWHGSYRGFRASLERFADRDVVTKAEAVAAMDDFRGRVREVTRTLPRPAGGDRDALKAWRKLVQARLKGGLKAQLAKAQPMGFSAFADLYVSRHVEMNGLKSADTISYRMAAMKAHFGDRPLADIRTADIEDFLATLRQPAKLGVHHKTERVRTPSTVNRYRSQLCQMFNFAVLRDYLQTTPFNKAGVRKTLVKANREDNQRTRRLSADEEARLMKHAAPALRPLIVVALYSGMRRGEMLALTWADLAARPGWIRLRGSTTKSGKPRWVPVLPNVAAVFEFLKTDANGDEKPADGPVFTNEVGEPIKCFRTAWEKTRDRAGVRDYHWHDLRHEYASRLAESGVPLVQVQELLGHASIVTTERYNTNQAERLQAAVQVLHPAASGDTSDSDDQADPMDDQAGEVSQSLHTDEHDPNDPANTPQIS